MKKIMNSALTVIAAFLTATAVYGYAQAGGMPESKAEYSAATSMETDDTTIKGKVFHTPNKERREMHTGGQKNIMIIRQDKKLTWMLMPNERMYMESKMGSDKDSNKEMDASSMKIEGGDMGSETINGIATTKKKVVMKMQDGTAMGGYVWMSKEGIAVKTDMVSKGSGHKMRMKTELSDLKVGRQDQSLFEIPAGYKPMSFGGMMRDAGTEAGERDAERGRRRGRRGY
ncbi:MAG: hypothetical protein HY884_05135 [Deltaproteobacteria bacterium]|nr:hypothetical protein [Deltaproteobacteria bacterium]